MWMAKFLIIPLLFTTLARGADAPGPGIPEPDKATLRELIDEVRQLRARVLQLEAIAQVAGILLFVKEGKAGKPCYFMAADEVNAAHSRLKDRLKTELGVALRE